MAKRHDIDDLKLTGRTILVTGAASGIGEATATGLIQTGATVLVHGRTSQAAEEAVRRLLAVTAAEAGRCLPVFADLGSVEGVRSLAAQVKEKTPDGLHVLINNAGAAFDKRILSPDGIEMTIAVNHFAVAVLTDMLLDHLRLGANDISMPGRVINVTSVMEKQGTPVSDWTYPSSYRQLTAYSDAKLLNLAYTYALARRLEGTGVTVNAANPGMVKTGFSKKAGGTLRTWARLLEPLFSSPKKGARSSLQLAADPGLAFATGGYYTKGKIASSSKQSRNPSVTDAVFTLTEDQLSAVLSPRSCPVIPMDL